MTFVIGLDWGGAAHAVCVIDRSSGAVVDRFETRHDAGGLRDMTRRLARHGAAADLPVAVERPSGLIVDALVAAGLLVVPIYPNAVKASRPRYRASGAKDDRGDPYLLTDLLRTDGHRFRPLPPPSDAVRALRTLVQGRDDLVAVRVQLANQLRALLESFWPGAAAIFADIDSPIALVFLERYPTPDSATRVGVKRLASFLAQYRYTGRRSPEELLTRLRAAPQGLAGPAEAEAKGEMVRALVAFLGPLVDSITDLSARIRHNAIASEVGRILMSFLRAGQLCAVQILAELGEDRARYLTADQLAADAGLAPVIRQSGRSRGVSFRWACNRRLRKALTCFADNSRHACPWAASVYLMARGRGCRHPHAIRILGRAWLRVLWRAWQDRKPYYPLLHGAAQAIG
ncbi:IS110 family transposase [uncultured Jannaschia sp.]|uniref:IS110 family transposase n=1 Tax=uncultured Jannaschia sp. TaxID=293347 RepID=UPI00263843CC|nr:IS110 family transposase [uncultured Jannaschia sp.]